MESHGKHGLSYKEVQNLTLGQGGMKIVTHTGVGATNPGGEVIAVTALNDNVRILELEHDPADDSDEIARLLPEGTTMWCDGGEVAILSADATNIGIAAVYFSGDAHV